MIVVQDFFLYQQNKARRTCKYRSVYIQLSFHLSFGCYFALFSGFIHLISVNRCSCNKRSLQFSASQVYLLAAFQQRTLGSYNFGPVSILPALSKVYEKLVALEMTDFCHSEATLRQSISGFRKGHSRSTVLMGIRDDLLRAMKKGEVTLMVLADFSKAFDTVQYRTLILKLSALGFSTDFLKCLTSYLSNRSKYMQIDVQMST